MKLRISRQASIVLHTQCNFSLPARSLNPRALALRPVGAERGMRAAATDLMLIRRQRRERGSRGMANLTMEPLNAPFIDRLVNIVLCADKLRDIIFCLEKSFLL